MEATGNIRLQNVGSSSFEARFQEPNYKDGAHITEQASYVVVESGEWEMSDGTRFSAGTTTSNKLTSAGFETISFDNSFSDTPSLLTQVQTYNGEIGSQQELIVSPVNHLMLAMQEEESLNGGGHLTETIGWFAIDSGTANDGDTILEGGITVNSFNHESSAGSFSASFTDTPALIAKLGSYEGADPASLRTTEISSTGFKAFVAEEQSADTELGHIAESINFLAESDLSSNLIGEYGTLSLDHNWQTVSFNNSYTNPVVIVSDPSFNGGDPGNIRIQNVGSSSFEARFQEPNYKDGDISQNRHLMW